MLKPMLTPQQPPERHVYTVSELNRSVKQVLETQVGVVWLEGEISNLTKAASGHWYFSLKDSNAQIRCAMFRFKTRLIQFAPKEGDNVVVKGQVSLYENRGDYQLIADYMEPAGLGNLQARLNELIKKLTAEGLFEQSCKRPLPRIPKTIGVISSASGAAIHDVLTVLERRWPLANVILYPSLVQGAQAENDLLKAVSIANQRLECDVILLTRGGGSLEDLWCFNSEKLAYAIREAKIPIVAAVGHEVDVTIAELAADLRAATPSAAAELLVPDQTEMRLRLDSLQSQLTRQLAHQINQQQSRLSRLQIKITDPQSLLRQHRLQTERLKQQLGDLFATRINRYARQLHQLEVRLSELNPATKLRLTWTEFKQLKTRFYELTQQSIKTKKHQLESVGRALNVVSPLATLGRGFSIALDENGKILNRTADFAAGKEFRLRVTDGEVKAKPTATPLSK